MRRKQARPISDYVQLRAHMAMAEQERDRLKVENERLRVRVKRLEEALEPLARKEIPARPQGNAGAYSILHDEIRRARAALEEASDD